METKEKVEELTNRLDEAENLAVDIVEEADAEEFHESEMATLINKMENLVDTISSSRAKARVLGGRLE